MERQSSFCTHTLGTCAFCLYRQNGSEAMLPRAFPCRLRPSVEHWESEQSSALTGPEGRSLLCSRIAVTLLLASLPSPRKKGLIEAQCLRP